MNTTTVPGWRVFVFVLAFACLSAAQSSRPQLPNAVFIDPPRNAAHPMRNQAVWIPSGDVRMNGVMFAAAGVQPHPTVLLLHGLPGNEQNLDLAQTLRRAGYNVLTFHYRGTWGSPGNYTLARGVEDGRAALAFLQDPANVTNFHIDLKRLIIIGHSYGGFVAARVAAAAHPQAAAVIFIAPWSPAKDVAALSVSAGDFAVAAHRAFDDVEGRTGGYSDVDMAEEILTPGYDWHLEGSAAAIKHLPTLIMVAKYDSEDDQAGELIAALKAVRASDETTVIVETDHAFADHRIALQSTIVKWLQAREGKNPKSTPKKR